MRVHTHFLLGMTEMQKASALIGTLGNQGLSASLQIVCLKLLTKTGVP